MPGLLRLSGLVGEYEHQNRAGNSILTLLACAQPLGASLYILSGTVIRNVETGFIP